MLQTSVRECFILLTTFALAVYEFLAYLAAFFRQLLKLGFSVGPGSDRCTTQSSVQQGKHAPPPCTTAIILDASSTPIRKLADVIAWCGEGRAINVLVYRPQGLSKEQTLQLARLLPRNTRLQQGFGTGKHSASQDPSPASGKTAVAAEPLGASSPLPSAVWLLSGADAKWPLTQAAAAGLPQPGLHKDGSSIESSSRKAPVGTAASAPSLKQQLLRCAGPGAALEPNLALVCGDAFTTAGFPPWLLRFSELYHLRPLSAVSHADFKSTLDQYSKVKQRFGT